MGFLKFLQKKEPKQAPKGKLEIPPAPPTDEGLPDFPSEKEAKKEKPIEAPEPPKEQKDIIEDIGEEAVETQEDLLEKRPQVKPVFVRIGAYKDVLDEIMLINNILKESDDTITRVSEFKQDEDKEFNKWEKQLKDVQQKLIYADQALFSTK